ncbi:MULTISPECIES: calcium-binding protein [unclassified Microcoleus]|uniref:calcium-binding protein n=1 Tax=unclassified Microcoleus TaxID=2642155 RepID=UPI002FCEB77B
MASQIESNSGIVRASHIGNMIPNELRKTIDNKAGESNIKGANYLTLTPELKAITPSRQAVGADIDLDKIAKHLNSTANSELALDKIEIPDVEFGNYVKSTIAEFFSFDNLKNIPVTIKVNDLAEANIISDANKLKSVSDITTRASQGAKESRFFDADDADNLIEITPEDAPQLGGLRAWGGNDQIIGTQSNDTANGGAGNDTIVGARGDDMLKGGQGNDLIDGGEGDDIIMGNQGDDYLLGGAGNDVLRGGAGIDVLIGNAGNDILIGDSGADFLIGGEGADQFILRGDTFTSGAAAADRILDFNPSQGDIIKIANLKGNLGMDEILFAAVDVNFDGITDTAILCSCGDAVGVIMSTDPTKANLRNSIFMAGPQDTTLSQIG